MISKEIYETIRITMIIPGIIMVMLWIIPSNTKEILSNNMNDYHDTQNYKGNATEQQVIL